MISGGLELDVRHPEHPTFSEALYKANLESVSQSSTIIRGDVWRCILRCTQAGQDSCRFKKDTDAQREVSCDKN